MVDEHHLLQISADIIGWTYFICWTASNYPQTIMNFKKKSVAGYSVDFVILNLMGYFSYTIFTCTLYWNKSVRKEYLAFEHTKHKDVPVVTNDVAFAIHGLAITVVQVYQLIYYERGNQKVSYISLFVATCCSLLLVGFMMASISDALEWFWFIEVAGYIKMFMSFIKVIPQVYLNYKRKSTKGFIMLGILGDFVGGGCSVLQQIIYSVMNSDNKELIGNIPKLILAWQSLIFDTIFFWQHYVFYFGNDPIGEKEDPKSVTSENDSQKCSGDLVINNDQPWSEIDNIA